MEKPRACKTVSDLKLGEKVRRDYVISDADVLAFGELSGDFNPVHFDNDYAASTIFGRRIAHGMISVAKFSGIFGMDMPGLGTLWLDQTVKFLKPVFIGEKYTAIAEVVALDRRQATIATWVEDAAGGRLIEGQGVVIPITEQAKRRFSSVLTHLHDPRS